MAEDRVIQVQLPGSGRPPVTRMRIVGEQAIWSCPACGAECSEGAQPLVAHAACGWPRRCPTCSGKMIALLSSQAAYHARKRLGIPKPTYPKSKAPDLWRRAQWHYQACVDHHLHGEEEVRRLRERAERLAVAEGLDAVYVRHVDEACRQIRAERGHSVAKK
jgi:hypothetical protein